MRSPISIRRRAACAVGALSIGATGALALVGAPAASAATTPTSVYPVSLQPSPVAAVASAARPASIAVAAAATPLPASVDLTPWAVPAGDQGQIGSCASWTVGYTISGWYAKKQGQLGHPYAPLFLYTQQTNGQGGGAWGTTFYGNLSTEMNGGVDTLADFTQGNYNPNTVPTPAEKANAQKYKITSWSTLYYSQSQSAAQGQTAIKTALSQNKPVALGMDVFYNFFGVRAASDHYDAISGAFMGRHAVAVLAYDSYGVKIENSWGAGWGNQGFAWLSWGFLAAHTSEAYSVDGFTAPQMGTAPAITTLSASSGPWTGGGTVTVQGADLTGATVAFGANASPAVTVAADGRSLTALVPMAATGKVAVAVTTPAGGTSNALDYTYVAATPTLTAVSSAFGPNSGGNTVTVTGTHLFKFGTTAHSVLFGTVPSAKVTVAADGRSLTAVVPTGAVGTVDVKVVNYGGTSNTLSYAYRWAVTPIVTAWTASATVAPGNVVLSGWARLPNGTNLAGLGVVLQSRTKGSTGTFTNVATSVTAANGSVSFARGITVSTEYRITLPGDVSSTGVVITVQALPAVTAVSATSGPRAGGQTIVVTGTSLTGATVTLGGVAAPAVVVNANGTSVTFKTPAHVAGTVDLVVKTVVGSINIVRYTYMN